MIKPNEKAYLDTVNIFHVFWQKHADFHQKPFLQYLSPSKLKNRLRLDAVPDEYFLV